MIFLKSDLFQVNATSVIAEADQVQKGIVDLIIRHGIRKLVVGAVPEK